MKYMHSEWRSRIDHWVEALKEDLYLPLGRIDLAAFFTMDHLPPEEAAKGDFKPMQPGEKWGKTWEYCWMRGKITLPEAAAGKRIVMDLQTGWESTIFLNGLSFGTRRAEWVTVPHHYIEDNVLTTSGVPGESYDLLIEAYGGHDYPEHKGYACATGPVLPGSYEDLNGPGPRNTLGDVTFGVWNEDAYQLYMDMMTLKLLVDQVDPESLRADSIATALEQATLIADFEQPLEDRIESYKAAREALRPALQAVNGTTAPVFYAVGNAHLDLAWLWPMAETHRKTSRTFAQQLRLLEQYPEYKYIQSQPAAYEMCREHYPELFDRIVNKDLLIRRLNVTVNNVVSESSANQNTAPQQLDLFTDYEALAKQEAEEKAALEKERRMQEAQLIIKQRFGKNAILRGLNFEEGATAKERNEQIGGHRAK